MLASDLIGSRAYARDGTVLGRILDVHGRVELDGTIVVTSVVVGHRRHLRLFGYRRPEIRGPWIIAVLARAAQGPLHEVAIGDIQR
jgi:sporulation protein YlmC with PRC-barrel domain